MTTRCIIGLSSGSSVDGVDAALLEVEGAGLELRARLLLAVHQPYPADLQERIRKTCGPGVVDGKQTALLHRLLGETFATAARQVADRASMSLQKVQCLGCPGHTIWHEPEGRFPSTLPLGMAAVVAERTGVTTVSDFPCRDLAVGGHGVPLAALVDYLLFRHAEENRILLHLGSAARVVYLPAGGRPSDTLGFEVGPCNVLLDSLMQRLTCGREAYDSGGKNGVQGRCLEPLLQRWLAHPYLQRRPPKSLARQAFGEEFLAQAIQTARQLRGSMHDLVCTATHFVARSIGVSLKRFLSEAHFFHRALLSGGGVRNGLILHLLEQQLAGTPLDKTNQHGIPADSRKAMESALLATLTLDGVPANLPGVTGAAGSRLLGSLTPGSSANWARCLAWMATQTAPLAIESQA
jgi:anhydro-N-acetylmuramic acid kinase